MAKQHHEDHQEPGRGERITERIERQGAHQRVGRRLESVDSALFAALVSVDPAMATAWQRARVGGRGAQRRRLVR